MKNEKTGGSKVVTPQDGGVYIMRIATVLLAIVSWWSTAQRMKQFVFEEEWQANIASLAIQGILLSLNFYLPDILRQFKKGGGKAGFLFFTAVVLSCSSIFSYIYIANYAYTNEKDTNNINAWDMDSQLLVQSTYREELYDANDYAEGYMESLQSTLSAQISNLYVMANALEGDGVQVTDNLNLEGDRTRFESEDFVKVSTDMTTAINVMEAALAPDATKSDREYANNALGDLVERYSSIIQDLQTEQIPMASDATDRDRNALEAAENRINNPPQGADLDELNETLNEAQIDYNESRTNEQNLRDELARYREALTSLQQYQTYLGFSSTGAGQQISMALLEIQRGLFQSGTSEANPDELEQNAVDIFEHLLSSNQDFSGNTTEYQSMLMTMDAFIQDLSNYGEVASIRDTLDDMISELKNVDYNNGEQAWQNDWKKKLNELKAQIGSLPIYTDDGEPKLSQYSRTAAMNKLDIALRNYIAGHNDAEQAFIYMISPYRVLAVFSFVLAYLLDIAAFITGIVINRLDDKQKQQKDNPIPLVPISGVLSPATFNHYLYLNGDYTKEDNVYRYFAVDGTRVTDVRGPNANLLPGYYLEQKDELQQVSPQQLAFAKMPGGPRDGIYQNCSLQYSDHMLLIKENSEQEFSYLAPVDQNVSVYRIQKDNCICETLQDLRIEELKLVIVALNTSGSLVTAIYLLEKEQGPTQDNSAS